MNIPLSTEHQEPEVCPCRDKDCSIYLHKAADISQTLADRIVGHYCTQDYNTCCRYRAAQTGSLDPKFDIAPWSDVLT